MKKIIGFIFLFVSVNVLAQNKSVEDTDAKPAITAIGKPDGEKTTMKIGKEGGSFTSSDGKIRLVIPEGAVSKKTTFSIQPAVNNGPNGNGKVYQMEPSGIQFKKSLQLIFYYNKEELKGNMQLLLGISMQNDKGEWFQLSKFVLDTLAKTITGSIKHFSSYSVFNELQLYPVSARVKVDKSVGLSIRIINPPPPPVSSEDDELAPLIPSKNISSVKKISDATMWKVNDIVNGNTSVGQIAIVISDVSVTYKAPASIPEKNPVAVTVKLTDKTFTYKGIEFKDLTLVSNITIYNDAYEVKMVAAIIGGSPEAWGGITTNRDEGSFIVSLEKDKPAVINIKNQMEVMTDNCMKIITNPNSNTGIFHVAGVRQIKITPANPPGQPYPIVEIFFIPYPIELTRFKFICPPPPSAKETVIGKIDLSQMAMLVFFGKPALPQYIKFIAKEEEQIILESPPGVREIYYKISVKKVREE